MSEHLGPDRRVTTNSCVEVAKQIKAIFVRNGILAAADRHGMKAFYQGPKAIYGPIEAGSAPVEV